MTQVGGCFFLLLKFSISLVGQNILGEMYKHVLILSIEYSCLVSRWHIGRSSAVLAPVRTSDVGQGQCQEKFFMVSRSVGRRGVGRRRALWDSGRRTDGSFYFFLEPPGLKLVKTLLSYKAFFCVKFFCLFSNKRIHAHLFYIRDIGNQK